MKRFLSAILLLALASALLLSGCAQRSEDTVTLKSPVSTESPAPIATEPPSTEEPAPVDAAEEPPYIDFRQANEALQVPLYWKNSPHRVLKSYLTIPSTTPIEIAHGLDDLNGVVYVGTDEEGRQYLAIFDTVERDCEKVYTAEAGMKIVSVTENVKRESYKDRAAYCWVETDGDYWRILFNDDSPDPDYTDLSEFTYAEGRLSEGSAFIPRYSEDIRSNEWKLALVSPADATELPYLFRGSKMPIPIDSNIASANDFPIFALGAGQFIHTGMIEGQEHFIFHDLYENSCTSSPFGWFSYRLPAGENLVRIVEGSNNFMGNIDLCLLTDAGNCYGYVHEDTAPYLVLRNVTQAMGSRIDCTFLLTEDDSKLYTWNGVVGNVPLPLYYAEDVTLTGLAEGYVTKETNEPYEVFVFSDESDGQFIYDIAFEAYPRNDDK